MQIGDIVARKCESKEMLVVDIDFRTLLITVAWMNAPYGPVEEIYHRSRLILLRVARA